MNNDPEDRIKTHYGWSSIWIWWLYGIYSIYVLHIQFTSLEFIVYIIVTPLIPIASSPSYLIAKIFAKPVDKFFNSLDNGSILRGMLFGVIELGIYFVFNFIWTIFLANLLLSVI